VVFLFLILGFSMTRAPLEVHAHDTCMFDLALGFLYASTPSVVRDSERSLMALALRTTRQLKVLKYPAWRVRNHDIARHNGL